MRFLAGRGLAALVALALPAVASAATVPFTEEFTTGASSWRGNPNSAGSLDAWSASGGADGGGFVSESFNFVGSVLGAQAPVIFRGPAAASGGAFTGNWIADAVREVSVYVRHDAPVPITFFARFASPMGFPGAIAVDFSPVAAGEWTELTFLIDPTSPQWASFEGSDFATVFSSIGIVQFGAVIPEALAGVDQSVRFDLDRVSLRPVPEAGALGAFSLAACALLAAVRSRKEA